MLLQQFTTLFRMWQSYAKELPCVIAQDFKRDVVCNSYNYTRAIPPKKPSLKLNMSGMCWTIKLFK